jgi:anti-sigma regulatory factor (Ser/Thr protein kinase)
MTALLYTDGLVERRGERLDDGLARVREAAAGGGAVQAICRRVLMAADVESADDDVTLVVVRGEPTIGRGARLKLSPDPEALRSLRRVLARWLEEAGAERDEVHDLVMAANEAWQNGLEHGTGFARTTIDVELEVAGGCVTITVRDAGRRERSQSDPDRGRGIELMRALADEVSLELAPHGSTVRLRRRLRSPASEPRRMADREPRVAPPVG